MTKNLTGLNKILIVDDEKASIVHLEKTLSRIGLNCAYISRGNFLFNRLDEEKFDLVLLDINLPGKNGIELLREIRASKKYSGLGVIMMTSELDDNTLVQCFEAGADDFLTKPLRDLVIESRVKAVLEKINYIRQIENQRNELDQRTRELKIALDALKERNAMLTSSISYAKRIQDALFPNTELLKKWFEDYFIFLKPRDIVSGDIYWFTEVDDIFIVAEVDCTGHGVPGALMGMIAFEQLTEIVNVNRILSPDKILTKLHNGVRSILRADQTQLHDGMAVSICCIDRHKKTLLHSGANSPLLIFQNHQPTYIPNRKGSIGSENIDLNLPVYTFDLSIPTSIYLYSDGFQDQFGGEKGKKYMSVRFREFLASIHRLNFKEQRNRIEEELNKWMLDNIQVDDISIIGLKIS